MERNLAACLGIVLAMSGCAADYLNHYDTVTLAAGDANRAKATAIVSLASYSGTEGLPQPAGRYHPVVVIWTALAGRETGLSSLVR
jgi:hypothetical protein